MSKEANTMSKKTAYIGGGILAGAIVIALVIVLILRGRSDDLSARQITVFDVVGEAVLNRGNKELSVNKDMKLKSGDEIKVGNAADAFIRLCLDDDKFVYAQSGTDFSVEATGTAQNSKSVIHLVSGGDILCEVQNKLEGDSSFSVQTPNTTMAIRGTIIGLNCTESTDENGNTIYTSEALCLDGDAIIAIKTPQGKTIFAKAPAGEGLSITGPENVMEVTEDFDPDQVVSLEDAVETLKELGIDATTDVDIEHFYDFMNELGDQLGDLSDRFKKTAGGGDKTTPTPSPTAEPSPEPSETPTPEPPTDPPTEPPTLTPMPTEEPTPAPTEAPTATATPRPTATATPRPTATPVPTATPTPEPTLTPVPTPSTIPTATPTPEPPTEPPTETPSPSLSPTPTPTPTPTPSPTPEPTPEPTEEPTPEPTEEPTPEPTEAPTPTPEPTVSVRVSFPDPAMQEAVLGVFVENPYIQGLAASGTKAVSFTLKAGESVGLDEALQYEPSDDIGYSWDSSGDGFVRVVWMYNGNQIDHISVESLGGSGAASISVEPENGYTARLNYIYDGMDLALYDDTGIEVTDSVNTEVYYSVTAENSKAINYNYGTAATALFDSDGRFYFVDGWNVYSDGEIVEGLIIENLTDDLSEYAGDGIVDLYANWVPAISIYDSSWSVGGTVTADSSFAERTVTDGGDAMKFYVIAMKKAASSGSLVLPKWQYTLGTSFIIDGSAPGFPIVAHSGWVINGDPSTAAESIPYSTYLAVASRTKTLSPYGTELYQEGAHIVLGYSLYMVPDNTDLFTPVDIVYSSGGINVIDDGTTLCDLMFSESEEYDSEKHLFGYDYYSGVPITGNYTLFGNDQLLGDAFAKNITFEKGKVYRLSLWDASEFISDTGEPGNAETQYVDIDPEDKLQGSTYDLAFTLEAIYHRNGAASGSAVSYNLGTVKLKSGTGPQFISSHGDTIESICIVNESGKLRIQFNTPDAILFDFKLKILQE